MTDSKIIYEINYCDTENRKNHIMCANKEKITEKAKEILLTTSTKKVELFEHKISPLLTFQKNIEVIEE